jgi:hypothetical protein
VGFGLVGTDADEGNVAAVGVLSSSLGVLGVSGRSEPCQANRWRNSLEKISQRYEATR